MSKFAETAGLTEGEWAVVKEAAITAAPVFAARGWEWWMGDEDRQEYAVPDVFQIAETLVRLTQRAKENESGMCGSGRFHVDTGWDEGMLERTHHVHISLDMTSDDQTDREEFEGVNPHYEFPPETVDA